MKKLKTIFIVGSKPELYWPCVVPDKVYCANSSLRRLENIGVDYEVTWVVNRFSLYRDEGIADAVCHFTPSEIVFFGGEPDSKNYNRLRLRSSSMLCNVRELKKIDLLKMKIKYFGIIDSLAFYARYRLSRLPFFKSFGYQGKGGALNISAGMVALVNAIQEFGTEGCKYYLVGIGFSAGEGHYDNPGKKYPHDHVANDVRFLRKMICSFNADIVLTDPDAEKVVFHTSAAR